MFIEELNFFIENQDQLVREHRGKVLVIKGRNVIGVYPSSLSAYLETQKEHELGSFMIQLCLPGPEAYTVNISSNILSF
ncbi:MAG: hypothetical protein WAW37_06130 [Syntrophobacteraceae bacterium]